MTVGLVVAWFLKAPTYDNELNGTSVPALNNVRKEFEELLSHENEGAAFAVYKDDELLVDLWGGYAERDALRLWTKDTITVAFSSTKAIGALIIAILVSRGHISYDDLVTKYWPEFGKHGKQNITVLWIVEHRAGLAKFDGDLSIKQSRDHRYISKLIENTKPMWPPGTAVGYHAITYGWLLDQLVRRADPEHRSIAQFYREEIQAHMKEKDFYLGLPRSEHYRVARIMQATPLEFLRALITSTKYAQFTWNVIQQGGECFMCVTANYPPWMSVLARRIPYNDPAVREVENVAALGIGTARALANVVATILKEKLISDEVWDMLSRPTALVTDKISGNTAHRGHGFFFAPHPTRRQSYLMLHGGHGMQCLIFDPKEKVVIALLRNGLSWDLNALQDTIELAGNVFRSLRT